MSKIILPKFEDFVPHLDFEKIAEVIRFPAEEREGKTNFSEQEFEDIKTMVWNAGEKWLPRDMYELDITGIEQKVTVEKFNAKGFIDIEGVLTRPSYPSIEEYQGKKKIVDWKSTSNALQESWEISRWRNKKIDSWQWRLYAYFTNASLFEYRGICRLPNDGICATKDILLIVPPHNTEQVETYLRGSAAERDGLYNIGAEIWPQDWDSCNKWGRECPFKRDCEEFLMPKYLPPRGALSYTQLERYRTCPEFCRRVLIAPESDDGEFSGSGKGFHRGMAELYEQAVKIKDLIL